MKLVEIVSLNKHILDFVFRSFNNACSYGVEGRACCVNFKVVIAVNTGDFFNDVSLDCNILCCSPAWNRYAEVIVVELNLKAEAFECCNNSVVADFNACVAVNKVFVKVKNNCVIPECVLVCERRNNLDVAVILFEKIYKSCNCSNSHFRIKTFFISH